MSEWRDISTAPRGGVFVLLHNGRWSSDVEGFWHKGSQCWSANTRIPGIENRVTAVFRRGKTNRSPVWHAGALT